MTLLSEGGRYAPYILAAFAVSAVVFAGLIADTLLRARHWRREVERLTPPMARQDSGPAA